MSAGSPATSITPHVHVLLAARDVVWNTSGANCEILDPLPVIQLTSAGRRLPGVWVYVQIAEGLGTFDVALEFCRVEDTGRRVPIGTGPIRSMTFTPVDQLIPVQTAFHLRSMPLPAEGLYELRLVADTGNGFRPLTGQTFRARALF